MYLYVKYGMCSEHIYAMRSQKAGPTTKTHHGTFSEQSSRPSSTAQELGGHNYSYRKIIPVFKCKRSKVKTCFRRVY